MSGTVAFASLPQDLQVLISDFVDGGTGEGVVPEVLPLVTVDVRDIPVVPLDPFDRGAAYAMAMNAGEIPPIVVAEGRFMDGKHRTYAARLKGWSMLSAIDLTGLIHPRMLEANSMGSLRGTADPAPAPGL